jgi:hypothetical protein
MGLAGGVVMKSGIFQRFLFGDEEKGQKGLISGVKDAWSKHFPKGEEDVSAAGIKAIGMTGMGTAAGGLIGTLIGGPVVGALAGFALSVKAQGGNFKEWLFGKEDGLSIGDGKKVKKQGVIGVIGNAINANIIKPMKTQFSYMAEDAMNVLEHKVLAPFAFAAEFAADKLGGITQKITSGASSLFNKVTHSITSTIGKLFSPITEAVGNTMQKATDFVYNGFKKVVSAPGALISAVIKTFDLKEKFKNLGAVKFVRGLFADARNLIFKGIQGVFKGIFNVITAPFKGIGKLAGLIGKGARSLGSKIAGIQIGDKTIGERFKDRFGSGRFKRLYDNFKEELDSRGVQFGSLTERMKLNKLDYQKREAEIKENRKNNERHDKNAKIIQRYTKGQFSEDTDDARNWLKYHKPDIYSKYFGEGSTSGKSVTAEIEESRNGASINGMSDDAVLSANPDTLNPESRQTQAILKVGNTVLGIYKILNGENPTDEELAEKAAEEKENQKRDRQELKGSSKEDLINELHNAGVDDFDSNISEEELRSMARRQRQIDRGIIPNAPTVGEQRKWSLSAFKERVSNYFKNDFMSNTRNNLFGKKDEAEEAVDEATAETGENVQKHSLGGILKKGLSLIGEKGAELLRLGDDGEAEVLSSDDTKKAAKEAKNKKKKLSDFFKKKKESDEGFDFGNALEEQDDEGIINRIKHAAYIRNNTTNIEEYRKAMEEGQAALNARFEDMRQDSLDKAKRNAKSADRLKAEMEAQKEKDEQKRYRADMLKATLAGSEATNKFKDLWSSIFSKKGLLTGALLLGYAWLKKNAPEILSMLGGILSGIGTFATSALGDAAKQFLNTEKNATRTDGNTMGEQLEKNIEDIKNGDILTDAEGNATHQSESRAKFLLRTGMNFLNRNHKTPGFGPFFGKNAKIANAEKGVFKIGEKIANGSKNLGTKLFSKSDWEKTTGKLVGNTSVSFLDDGARAMSKSSWDTFAKQLASEGIDPQLYAAQEGIKVLDDTEGLGRKLITKVKGSKAGQAVSGFADDVVKKGTTFADNIAQGVKGSAIGKAASSAKTAIGNGAAKVGEKIANKATANDGLLSKVAGYIDEFFKFVTSKFGKKTGTEVGTSIFKSVSPNKIVSALTKKWSTICEKLAAKISSVTGVKASAAAVSFGLSETIFATIGALNGVSGTAKLFRVSADKVDGNMRLIAGIFGALTGTTLGSIIDIILSFAGDIMGIDILSSMAVGLYNVMVGKDSEKAKALEDAQSAFMDSYLEDRDSKLQEQYETQKKAGIIGPDVTYDMFAEGLKNGTYSASYKSFDDYNTEKNASVGDKVLSGLGRVTKGTGNLLGKAGKSIFGGTDSYTDATGNVYTKNTNGTYQIKASSGEDLGYVSANAINLNSMQKNTSKGLVGNIADGAKNLGSKAIGFVKDAADGTKDLLANAFDRLKNLIANVGPPTMDYIKGSADSIDFGCPEDNPGKPIITAIEKSMQFLTFGPHVIVKLGKTIGDFIGNAVDGFKNSGAKTLENAKAFITGGVESIDLDLSDDNIFKPIGNIISKVLQGILIPVRFIGKIIGGISDTVGGVVDNVKDFSSGIVDGAKRVGSTVVNGIKETASPVVNSISSAWNFLTGGSGLGGRGEETLNGASYFSQNDNRWADNSYSMGGDNATMSNTGCGPTAMAMAINTARGGGNVTPTQMADVAQMTGMRDETGTNANFISQSANMAGLNSEERFMPSSYDLNQQLDSGNPVVLLGRTGGNGDVPYTDAGHYVVAVGRDPSGNILVNDPRGRSYSGAYNPEELANSTEASWSIGNGGYGRKQNRIRRRRGGFGPEMATVAVMDGGGSTSSQTGIKDWLSVVAAVKKAIGVQQKGYSQSGYIDFTVDGKTYNTRRDCSGFVSACLNVYTGEKHLTSSRGFASDANIASWLTKYGFSKMNWPGWENTKAGDILVIPGHVEISAQDGVKKVYNCGSDSSCNNPGITDGSKSAYTYIWRPNNAGTGGQILTTNAGVVGSYDSGSFASASPTGGTQETGIGALASYLGNFFGEFGKRAISGDFSNTDYSSLLSNDSSSSGYSSGYSGYSAGSPSGEYVGIAGGGTTEENAKVLAKVLAKNGFNANQIGGILSNFNQESGIDTTSVETIFDEKFKIGSRKQSAMSDFTTFTLNKVFPAYEGRLNINKNAYRGSGSSYWPGIGLGQWTGPRAEALVNYARANNKNWYDPDLQVNYMINQDSFKGRLETYKNTTAGYSPREAAKYFENKWEGSTHNEAGHQATADAWAAKVPELIGGAGEGKHKIRKTTGGRGAKPDYRRLRNLGGKSGALSIDSNMVGTSTSGNTSYVSNYIRTTKDTSIQELFVNAIEILAAIAGNTKEASTKLEALKSLSNISTNTSTSNNNIIVNGERSSNNQHKTGQQVNYGGRGSTEADRTARAIAMGGY